MPFDPEQAPPQDFTSLDWAIWTFRDRTGSISLTDAQVAARLQLHARTVGGVVYHRPLAAAADLLTRPEQLVERDRNDIGEKFVDPLKVAESWRLLQAELDRQIPESVAEGEPTTPDGLDLSIEWGAW